MTPARRSRGPLRKALCPPSAVQLHGLPFPAGIQGLLDPRGIQAGFVGFRERFIAVDGREVGGQHRAARWERRLGDVARVLGGGEGGGQSEEDRATRVDRRGALWARLSHLAAEGLAGHVGQALSPANQFLYSF